MSFCVKCGRKLPDGATFCPNCGVPVTPVVTRARFQVKLGKKEKEMRRAEEAKFIGWGAGGVGTLLLTNRRLMFNGELLDEKGEGLGPMTLEWFLGDVIDISHPSFRGKDLLVRFQKLIMKIGHPNEATGKTPATELPKPVVYKFTNINQPKEWKLDITKLKKEIS